MVHGTPVDVALPMLCAVVVIVASVSHAGIAVAAPALMIAEMVFADERTRLLSFGVVLAIAFGASLVGGRWSGIRASVCAAGAIVVLRWIPLSDVRPFREVLLIVIAIGIVGALRWSAPGVVIAAITALFTPAFPLRTLALPLLMFVVCLILGITLRRAEAGRYTEAFALVLSVPLLFFAWSGAFARSLPVFIKGPLHPRERFHVRIALKPGQSALLDVPPTAKHLVLSGANMARVRAGTVVARVEPQRMEVRIGDIADWGAFRRDLYYRSRNSLPRDSAGIVRDYGYSSWIDGAGRIKASGTHMRVTASSSLPDGAVLQIEGFEY